MLRFAVVAVALGAGCAAPNRQLASAALKRLAVPADSYAALPPAGPDPVRATWESGLGPELRPRLVHDPRLDAVAVAMAEHYAARREIPARDLVQWVNWRVGFPGGYVHARVWRAGGSPNFGKLDADLKLDALAAEIPASKAPGPLAYGVARLVTLDGEIGQAVVIGTRRLELTQLAKHLPVGAPIAIAGRLPDPTFELRFAYDDATDEVVKIEVTVAQDGTFRGELPPPTAPGRYYLRIRDQTAERELGVVPIYVGVAEPSESEPPIDAVEETKALRRKLTALRVKKGRPAGDDDATLNALVQGTADAVCTRGQSPDDRAEIAEVLKGYTAATDQRVRRIGSPYRMVKDPSDEAATKIAIATCEILDGPYAGQQYVLIVSGTPR